MARIRSLKPEFPQSESMGNVSRDARLTFVLLWTLADDEGRLRGNSRMLASLLFPYDDDAPSLIDGWLIELEHEACIVRYKADGNSYLQICNWLIHQKIDKPSKSKIPPFDESSRILASPREASALDQGSKDQGVDQGSSLVSAPIESASLSPSAHEEAPPEKKPTSRKHTYSPADMDCAEWLYAELLKIRPELKKPGLAAWANDVRLMVEQDGRSHREICELMRWACSDSFWRGNVMSPSKLREQFDQLAIKARKPSGQSPPAQDLYAKNMEVARRFMQKGCPNVFGPSGGHEPGAVIEGEVTEITP